VANGARVVTARARPCAQCARSKSICPSVAYSVMSRLAGQVLDNKQYDFTAGGGDYNHVLLRRKIAENEPTKTSQNAEEGI
jgi:hypothetical protein